MRVVLCSQRNYHPRLPLLLSLIVMNTFVFRAIHIDHLEGSRIYVGCFVAPLHDKQHLWQIFNRVGYHIVYKFVVDPNESCFDRLKCCTASLSGQLSRGRSKFIQVGCYYLMQRTFLQLHLPKYNSMSLPLLNNLRLLIEKVRLLLHLHLLRFVHLEHLAVVLLHRYSSQIIYNTCIINGVNYFGLSDIISMSRRSTEKRRCRFA